MQGWTGQRRRLCQAPTILPNIHREAPLSSEAYTGVLLKVLLEEHSAIKNSPFQKSSGTVIVRHYENLSHNLCHHYRWVDLTLFNRQRVWETCYPPLTRAPHSLPCGVGLELLLICKRGGTRCLCLLPVYNTDFLFSNGQNETLCPTQQSFVERAEERLQFFSKLYNT